MRISYNNGQAQHNGADVKHPIWVVFVVLAVVVAWVVGIPALLAYMGLSPDPTLRLVEALFGWPTAVLIVALVFLLKYREAIRHMLLNLGSMKLPGGFEFQRQTPSLPEKDEIPDDGSVTLTVEQSEQVAALFKEIQEKQKFTEKEKRDLKTQYFSILVVTTIWKFKYANLFLVPNSKKVLFWVSQEQRTTRKHYHSIWETTIVNISQRDIILSVLIDLGFIVESQGLIEITQHGYNFLQYIGQIPYQPQGETGGT
jgi:hypothetical protein